MKYIVYKTTNIVNGKYYIGVHQTTNIQDTYIGCGLWYNRQIPKITTSAFINAVRKYGYDNFKREILFIFETRIDAYNKEKELVNLADINCYNSRTGGDTGYQYTDKCKEIMSFKAKERSQKNKLQTDILINHSKFRAGKSYTEIYGTEKANEILIKKSKSALGKKHSIESKNKMSEQRKGKDCGNCAGRKYVWDAKKNVVKRLFEKDINEGLKNGEIIEVKIQVNKYRTCNFQFV